jgi:thioredoxin 1
MKSKRTWKYMAVFAIGLVLAGYVALPDQWPFGGVEVAAQTRETGAAGPAAGRVTLIDLGANSCIPCKMMAPIIEELQKEYAGRADIIFIDVWKEPDQAKKYGIRAIPTQIFFDAGGKEVHRHVGFMDKKQIVEVLTRLGVS